LHAIVGAHLTGVSCLHSIVGAQLSARYCRSAIVLRAKDGVPHSSCLCILPYPTSSYWWWSDAYLFLISNISL